MHVTHAAASRPETIRAAGPERAGRDSIGTTLCPGISPEIRTRHWVALGGLAAGLGLLAGGLEPVGLSLALVGAAVLLGEMERSGPQRASRAARTNAAAP